MAKETFKGKLVRIYCSEADTAGERSLYEAIIERCQELGIAGATAYRGLEGFGMSAEIHKLRIWPFSNQNAPVMVSIIDREEAIAKLLPALDELVGEGLIATSDVQVVRFTREPTAEA